jgi:hypothetical protein
MYHNYLDPSCRPDFTLIVMLVQQVFKFLTSMGFRVSEVNVGE